MNAVKAELTRVLQSRRAVMLSKLDGLSEYDRRRPATPTGTNLLGLVKHLAGLEYGYLGISFGRPPIDRPSWFRDDPYAEIDMWATPDESTTYITTVYRQACAHADLTIADLDLDAAGHVEHWDHPATTLGVLLIRMLAETAQHAGHADIIREQTDGQLTNNTHADTPFWRDRTHTVQQAANHFRFAVDPEPDYIEWDDAQKNDLG
ncbi:DinB family protein [Kribbella sp. NPDC051952]|uniref:DinB family protein n=1 Tax=Kribbella sp. NPDC051952 TaxID=3154851 RepID=UPI00344894F3